jgi:hypothetical protein
MIVSEGRSAIPVLYQDWAEWRDVRRDDVETAPAPPRTTAPCCLCWGAGRYLDPAKNGEGLVSRTCPRCDGLGRLG